MPDTKPTTKQDTANLLEIGKPWLTSGESARVESLAASRRIFEGKHREHFYEKNNSQHQFKAVGPEASSVLYIADNLAGLCSLKLTDMLFGEPLLIEPADDVGAGKKNSAADDAIKRISDASRLPAELYELAVETGWAGKAYLQVIVADGAVRIETVTPENIFPTYAPGSGRLAEATIKTIVTSPEDGEEYCHVVKHGVGHIISQVYKLGKKQIVIGRADLKVIGGGEEFTKTGLTELTVVEAENYTPGGRGASDYSGNESLLDEINNRITQISRILDKHGDPAVVALASLFDENGALKISGQAIVADTLEKGPPVQYITWDAKLEQCAAQLDRAIHAYLRNVEVAPVLVGLGGNTSADSWKKHKLAVSQTLARVNRNQTFISPAILAAMRVAMALENIFVLGVSYPANGVQLTFSDGLPVDELEQMQIVSGYYDRGLMSLERALLTIHDDPKVAEEELSAIQAENEAKLPTAFREGGIELAANEE